ncbi:PilZ domain-containing protein [Sphingosinicella sp.]|uniref:PilZ domain-containing protein n=1 Tax=Sphingosinicella sp. TaxID=1917971 RepID=UPI0040383267
MLDTVYSLSGEVPATGVADDPGALFQPGALVLGSVRQICQIRKLGAGGAVLHADVPIEPGARLELELETGEPLVGTVAWRQGSEIGLKFDRAVDILPIIARNLASQPGERRRMPRIEIACPALLEHDGRTELAAIRDIAQGGVKLEMPYPLAQDLQVIVTPEGLHPVEGVVRWTNGRVAGIAFAHEISWQELMPWLRLRSQLPDSELAPPRPSPAMSSEAAASAAPSVQLNLSARVREGLRRWTIDVDSLDSRTVSFESYAPLRLGTLLWVVLPGLEGWPARIVANEGYRFTCEFTQPLHPAVLERILSAGRGNA